MAYKTKEAIKRQLKKQWESACNYYMVEICNMWDLDASNGFWVADEIGGTWCYGETLFIDMDNVKFCVENDVSYSEYMDWLDYCVWASEFNQSVPNLKSWHKGCPRVDVATQERLSAMKYELERLMEETKEKLF